LDRLFAMHAPPDLPCKQQGLRARLLAACWALLLLLAWATPGAAYAQGVELATLKTTRADGALSLEFAARITLPKPVEEALRHGVPVYFQAQATLYRSRWYWRDERVARLSRTWRIAYQPLTNSWRVGLGGLNQTVASLQEALAAASTSAGWKLTELGQIDPDKTYYLEFDYRLDTTQLPSPMQFGLVTPGDWVVSATRVLKVEP
jgi:Domain of unknown function (DUF4390)